MLHRPVSALCISMVSIYWWFWLLGSSGGSSCSKNAGQSIQDSYQDLSVHHDESFKFRVQHCVGIHRLWMDLSLSSRGPYASFWCFWNHSVSSSSYFPRNHLNVLGPKSTATPCRASVGTEGRDWNHDTTNCRLLLYKLGQWFPPRAKLITTCCWICLPATPHVRTDCACDQVWPGDRPAGQCSLMFMYQEEPASSSQGLHSAIGPRPHWQLSVSDLWWTLWGPPWAGMRVSPSMHTLKVIHLTIIDGSKNATLLPSRNSNGQLS